MLSCGDSFCVVLRFSLSGIITEEVCCDTVDKASVGGFSDGDLQKIIARTAIAIRRTKDINVIKFDFFIINLPLKI